MPLTTDSVAPPAPPASPPPAPPMAPVPPSGEAPQPPRRGLAIALIVIGVLLLAGQFLPALGLWNMWPLVIVIAGAVKAFTPGREGWNLHRLVDGFVTVSFGLVLLAITTGYVGFDVVWLFISLWPVLIIAAGLDILGKSVNQPIVRALGGVLVIAALGWSVAGASGTFTLPSLAPSAATGQHPATLEEPMLPTSPGRATLNLDAAAGKVVLSSGNDLVRAQASSPWGTPKLTAKKRPNSTDVSLSLSEPGAGFILPGSHAALLEAHLGESVVWDITAKAGACDLTADLSRVAVRNFTFKPGVSSSRITLGAVPAGLPQSSATIGSAISSIELRLPRGTPARIITKNAITSTNVSKAFVKRDVGVWESPGFSAAKAAGEGVWVVTIESAIGSVNVSTY